MPKLKKITIQIELDIWQQLKIKTIKNSKTIQEVLLLAILDYIAKNGKGK